MADIFQGKGWFTMGFDMDPTAAQIFSPANGSANNGTTPFGFGYSWLLNSNNSTTKPLLVNLTTLFAGIRFQTTLMPTTSGIILQWFDVTANAAQVTLRVFADGHLQFFLGSGTGTPLGPASAAGVIALSTWIYIETKVTISPTVGVVECRVNGASTVITASGLNTQSTANTWVSGFTLQAPVANNTFFDDWYMEDTTAAAPFNTYLGNVQIKGDPPNANSAVGGRNAWTPTNPTNVNFSNVANIPANAAQHNDDATPGDYDMFRFPALSAAAVLGVNEWALIELDSAGARTVALDAYSTTGGGSTDVQNTAFTPPAGTLTYFNFPLSLDPNTGVAWTVAGAGNVELGIQVKT